MTLNGTWQERTELKSIIWNVRSALCPIRQREKAILWQCSAAKKTVWAFQEKEAACLYGSEKRKRCVKRTAPFSGGDTDRAGSTEKRKEYLRFGDQLYLLPPQMVSLKGLKVLRPGLHIGTIKKNRFEPSHALALWLFPEDAKVQKEVEPDGTEAVKYLKGETLTGDTGMSAPCEKGWVLICTGNVSLGWGKMAAGTIKNHYPKGLRWM